MSMGIRSYIKDLSIFKILILSGGIEPRKSSCRPKIASSLPGGLISQDILQYNLYFDLKNHSLNSPSEIRSHLKDMSSLAASKALKISLNSHAMV